MQPFHTLVMCSLTAPEEVTEELLKLVTVHFNLKLSVIVQWIWFNSHRCEPGESVVSFIAQLQRLIDFGPSLCEMPCYCLVCRIGYLHIHKQLLAEPNLTLILIRLWSWDWLMNQQNKMQHTYNHLCRTLQFNLILVTSEQDWTPRWIDSHGTWYHSDCGAKHQQRYILSIQKSRAPYM